MAKTGFWLKGSNGKLAGATMYKDSASGETIIREVVKPSNPKTTAQNIQRIIMLTVAQSYSLMKEICDHSFEGVNKGRDTMAYYMKQNIQFCREKLAAMQAQGVDYYDMYNFLPLGSKGFVPNQYQIAMGSLPRIDCVLSETDYDYGFVPGIPANATYADVINAYGLQRGDQLTFMYLKGSSSFHNDVQFEFARVILDPTNEDFTSAALTTPFLDGTTINKPSVRNEGNMRFKITAEDGLGFRSRITDGGLVKPCVACGCIVSRKVGDSWNRSTTYLTYMGGYNAFSMGDCLDRAAEGVSAPLYSANPVYLNNAGEGGGAAAAAGENSGAGQGGNTTPSISVTGATVHGQSIIQGTIKSFVVDEDAVPESVPVVVTGTGVDGKKLKVYKNGTSTQVGATATFASSEATVNVPWVANEPYQIKVENEDGSVAVATDYTFIFEVSSGDES